ncbi:hypothetical protein EON79_14935 [bacterium]|nr:MAG: hypothetical protein EON79_14935 [bacterium]
MRSGWGWAGLLVLAGGCASKPVLTPADRLIRVRPAQEFAKAGPFRLRFDTDPTLTSYHTSSSPDNGIFSPSLTFDLEPVPKDMENWQLWMEPRPQFGASGTGGGSKNGFTEGESFEGKRRAMGSFSNTFVEPMDWRGRQAEFKGKLVHLTPTPYRAKLHGIAAVSPDVPGGNYRFTASTAETVDFGDGVSVRTVPTSTPTDAFPIEIRWDPKRLKRGASEPVLQNLKSSLGNFGSSTTETEGAFHVYRSLGFGPVTGPLNPKEVEIEFQFGNVDRSYPVTIGMRFQWLPVRLVN